MAAFRRGLLIASVTLVGICLTLSPALSWSRIGHEAIASIAESMLAPTARKTVRHLLSLEAHQSLAEVALWADTIRSELRNDAPMHSVRIPIEDRAYDRTRDCTRRLCVVEAINNYLSERSRTDRERLEAVKYVVHLVDDVHQPLHASSATGKELVALGRIVKLHKLWDTTLLGRAHGSSARLIHSLSASPVVECGSASEWATESHAITRTFVYPALPPSTDGTVAEITDKYAQESLKIIDARISVAGARLACVLNRTLGSPQRGQRPPTSTSFAPNLG
jgi:hypothetical protein